MGVIPTLNDIVESILEKKPYYNNVLDNFQTLAIHNKPRLEAKLDDRNYLFSFPTIYDALIAKMLVQFQINGIAIAMVPDSPLLQVIMDLPQLTRVVTWAETLRFFYPMTAVKGVYHYHLSDGLNSTAIPADELKVELHKRRTCTAICNACFSYCEAGFSFHVYKPPPHSWDLNIPIEKVMVTNAQIGVGALDLHDKLGGDEREKKMKVQRMLIKREQDMQRYLEKIRLAEEARLAEIAAVEKKKQDEIDAQKADDAQVNPAVIAEVAERSQTLQQKAKMIAPNVTIRLNSAQMYRTKLALDGNMAVNVNDERKDQDQWNDLIQMKQGGQKTIVVQKYILHVTKEGPKYIIVNTTNDTMRPGEGIPKVQYLDLEDLTPKQRQKLRLDVVATITDDENSPPPDLKERMKLYQFLIDQISEIAMLPYNMPKEQYLMDLNFFKKNKKLQQRVQVDKPEDDVAQHQEVEDEQKVDELVIPVKQEKQIEKVKDKKKPISEDNLMVFRYGHAQTQNAQYEIYIDKDGALFFENGWFNVCSSLNYILQYDYREFEDITFNHDIIQDDTVFHIKRNLRDVYTQIFTYLVQQMSQKLKQVMFEIPYGMTWYQKRFLYSCVKRSTNRQIDIKFIERNLANKALAGGDHVEWSFDIQYEMIGEETRPSSVALNAIMQKEIIEVIQQQVATEEFNDIIWVWLNDQLANNIASCTTDLLKFNLFPPKFQSGTEAEKVYFLAQRCAQNTDVNDMARVVLKGQTDIDEITYDDLQVEISMTTFKQMVSTIIQQHNFKNQMVKLVTEPSNEFLKNIFVEQGFDISDVTLASLDPASCFPARRSVQCFCVKAVQKLADEELDALRADPAVAEHLDIQDNKLINGVEVIVNENEALPVPFVVLRSSMYETQTYIYEIRSFKTKPTIFNAPSNQGFLYEVVEIQNPLYGKRKGVGEREKEVLDEVISHLQIKIEGVYDIDDIFKVKKSVIRVDGITPKRRREISDRMKKFGETGKIVIQLLNE